MEQEIMVTAKQEEKKIVVTIIAPNEKSSMNYKAEWFPLLDKKSKDLLIKQILQILRGSL